MKIWINRISEDEKGTTDIMLYENRKKRIEVWDFIDSLNGESKINNYTPIKVKKINKKGNLLNVTYLTSGLLVIDEQTVSVLKKYIDLYGELLPLDLKEKDKQLYIFNVTNVVDCLDEEKSELRIFTNCIGNVRKPVFKKELIGSNAIFKIPRHGIGFTFINDNLKEYIEKSNLEGFNFKLVWDSESDEKYRIF